jgi:hypothetical protein
MGFIGRTLAKRGISIPRPAPDHRSPASADKRGSIPRPAPPAPTPVPMPNSGSGNTDPRRPPSGDHEWVGFYDQKGNPAGGGGRWMPKQTPRPPPVTVTPGGRDRFGRPKRARVDPAGGGGSQTSNRAGSVGPAIGSSKHIDALRNTIRQHTTAGQAAAATSQTPTAPRAPRTYNPRPAAPGSLVDKTRMTGRRQKVKGTLVARGGPRPKKTTATFVRGGASSGIVKPRTRPSFSAAMY